MPTHDSLALGVVGAKIGAYRLDEFLGRGTYAEVFRCRCTSQSHWYALKIEAPPLEGDVSRLYEEFKFRKNLFDSGALVPSVSWLGRTPGGKGNAMMVMEYLYPTIEEKRLRYNAGIMPPFQVLDIARHALDGIKSIHGLHVVLEGISGRDLAYNTDNKVVFADFGRAKKGVCFVDETIECSYRVDLMQLALVLLSLTGAVVPKEPKNPTAQERLRFQDDLKKVDVEKIVSQLPSPLAPLGALFKHANDLQVDDYPDYDFILQAFGTDESSC